MIVTKKTREFRTGVKDAKRTTKPRSLAKSRVLDMIEALIANARTGNGICRHNHSIVVTGTGRILIDDAPHGYIDREDTQAAKYLIEHGYHIKFVRNSPVIHTPDGDAVNITVGDVERYMKSRRK